MKKLFKNIGAVVLAGALVVGGVVFTGASALASEEIIAVESRDEAPEGTVWTDGVLNEETCSVVDTGILVIPGEYHAAETELRTAYSKVIPGQEGKTHEEYKYLRTVTTYKTQYHFSKFTHTKTRTWVEGTEEQKASYVKWVWNGGNTEIAPTFPGPYWNQTSDTKPNKHDPIGVVTRKGGGASWYIYVETSPAVPGTPGYWSWSDYGPWTQWTPVTHESWQDSQAPLGIPQYHGDGDDYYREWQAQYDGRTQKVPNGTTEETTDWVLSVPDGEGWQEIDHRTVIDQENIEDLTVYYLPGNLTSSTLTDENYTTETPGEPWVKVGDKSFETKAAYTDPDVVKNFTYTYTDKECANVPPTEEPKPTEKPTVVPKTTKAPESSDTLAATGGESLLGYGILGSILMGIGATIVVARRRKVEN